MSDDALKYSDFDPVSLGRIKGWRVETGIGKDDRLDVLVRFFDGGALVLRGEMGGTLTLDVRGPNAPRNLYEVARSLNHEMGLPWTDPRTGRVYEPPASFKDA